jgi:hypothetical protein
MMGWVRKKRVYCIIFFMMGWVRKKRVYCIIFLMMGWVRKKRVYCIIFFMMGWVRKKRVYCIIFFMMGWVRKSLTCAKLGEGCVLCTILGSVFGAWNRNPIYLGHKLGQYTFNQNACLLVRHADPGLLCGLTLNKHHHSCICAGLKIDPTNFAYNKLQCGREHSSGWIYLSL